MTCGQQKFAGLAVAHRLGFGLHEVPGRLLTGGEHFMRARILEHIVLLASVSMSFGACSTSEGGGSGRPGDRANPAANNGSGDDLTCTDNEQNGAESDIDCGGSTCSKCIGGKRCGSASDCSSNVCTNGVCVTELGISSISPRSGPTTGGVPVTIEGDDFKEGAVVTVDGVRAEVTTQSKTQIVITLPERRGKVGKVDVAIVNPDQKTTTAKGGFGYYYGTLSLVEQAKRPVSYKPFSIASGDFDKDGHRDLAVANDNGVSVSILLGKGDGTFPFPAGADKFVEYPVGNLSICVVATDLDGDGNEDLVVTNHQGHRSPTPLDIDGDVSVLLGKGDGTFSPETVYFTGKGPSAVVVQDFDKDGIKDLAVVNGVDETVSILLGLGQGTFQSYEQQLRVPSGGVPRYLALADFNRDGWSDLAVASLGGAVNVLTGQTGGTFPPAKPGAYGTGSGTFFVATGDLDDNGSIDIITADRGYDQTVAGSVTTLLGKKDGTFPQKGVSLQAGRDPRYVAVGDLNGDGFLDIAVTNYADDTIGVLVGLGNGQFLPSVTFPIQTAPGSGNGPCSVLIDDLNEDGKNDLAVTNCAGNSVSVLLNASY